MSELNALQAELVALRTDMGRLQVKLNKKADIAATYRIAFATCLTMFWAVVGTVVVLKASGFIP